MSDHDKLELRWPGKDLVSRCVPHVLTELPGRGHRTPHPTGLPALDDNRLIHGDNLPALHALEQEFAGRFRCIYVDPPYNTGQVFAHYDDGLAHGAWLSMLRDRLAPIHRLLAQDGSLWLHLDDSEVHRARCLLDELFGEANFIATIVWEKDQGRRNDAAFSSAHDYILLYAKERERWRATRNLLPRTEAQNRRYRNPDGDPRGPWLQGDNGTAKRGSARARFPVTLPSGRIVLPPAGNYWRFSLQNLERARSEGRVHFGAAGDSLPVIKRYLHTVQEGVVPRTWWPADEVGSNQEAKRDHLRKLLPELAPFSTPKPERLLQRILHIATQAGDWVLDPFAGSGTTGSVAHKMGRPWVMIEAGEHCHTHVVPRLRKVLDGEDLGGITRLTDYRGGGGFRLFEVRKERE